MTEKKIHPLKDIEKAKRQVPKDTIVVHDHKKVNVDDDIPDPKASHFSGIKFF